jgi:type IX secretion system PorP/SprF family membrane protein
MNKFILSIIIALGFFTSATAQDEMIFNHYVINPVILNPAATGFNGAQNFNLHFKNQWTGFPGAPTTYAFNYNGSLGEKLGIGAWVSQENIASQNRLRAMLSYSFRFKINDFKGAMGLSTEFKRMGLNSDVLANPLLKQGDDLVNMHADGVSFFDATMGFYGTYQDKLTIGLSMPNLIQARLGDVPGVSGNANGGFKYYTFSLGYKQRSGDITIEPSLVLKKIAAAPFQVDLNLKGSFLNEKVIGAVSYRAGAGGGLGVLVGTKYNGMTFAYSYDYSLNRFQPYSGGGHEITVGYTIFPKAKSGEELIERMGGNYSN